jgi:hypothetical protein
MRLVRSCLVVTIFCCALAQVQAQDHGKWNFNLGAGPGFPVGNLSLFLNTGAHFVIGGGANFNRFLSIDTELMWHDLSVNDETRARFQSQSVSARQYSWTVNPILHAHLGKLGGYLIGGGGWYRRSGETAVPGFGVVCDPYWSWWFGCTVGSVNIVTASRSVDAFGENIGGGLTLPLGRGGAKFYTEIRYHHASYNKLATDLLPLTFGVRW